MGDQAQKDRHGERAAGCLSDSLTWMSVIDAENALLFRRHAVCSGKVLYEMSDLYI